VLERRTGGAIPGSAPAVPAAEPSSAPVAAQKPQ
jgi:hypothetical protein